MTASRALVVATLGLAAACGGAAPGEEPDAMVGDLPALQAELRDFAAAEGAELGLYFRSLGARPDSIEVGADVRMHAASTMKVPVMMQLYLDHASGIRSLDTSLEVRSTFASIVDGAPFELPAESDSDSTLYARMGESVPVRDMIDRMITWSSNLATNILIETAEPARVNAMLREFGADSMEVLRGVEDIAAFRAGLSNTTTARDLGVVMRSVAESPRFSEEARSEMLAILERQHFRDNIPAGLPPGTRVANKTGWITGINHDAAIVYPDSAAPYVLIVLVRGHPAEDQGTAFAAEVSRRVWDAWVGGRS